MSKREEIMPYCHVFNYPLKWFVLRLSEKTWQNNADKKVRLVNFKAKITRLPANYMFKRLLCWFVEHLVELPWKLEFLGGLPLERSSIHCPRLRRLRAASAAYDNHIWIRRFQGSHWQRDVSCCNSRGRQCITPIFELCTFNREIGYWWRCGMLNRLCSCQVTFSPWTSCHKLTQCSLTPYKLWMWIAAFLRPVIQPWEAIQIELSLGKREKSMRGKEDTRPNCVPYPIFLTWNDLYFDCLNQRPIMESTNFCVLCTLNARPPSSQETISSNPSSAAVSNISWSFHGNWKEFWFERSLSWGISFRFDCVDVDDEDNDGSICDMVWCSADK